MCKAFSSLMCWYDVETSYDFLVQQGRRIALISIIRDITERKRAPEQGAASEERFRALLERSADAISLLHRQGRHVYSSPASARIVGYEPTDSSGEEMFEQIHSEDVQQVRDVFAAILQQPGKSLPTQFRMWHKNGEWVWIEGTGTNLLDHSCVGAVVVNYRDFTPRKQLEEALRQSREQLEVILHDPADGISVQDPSCRIVYIEEGKGTRFIVTLLVT
jgi:PAS domain S-box-containing protein